MISTHSINERFDLINTKCLDESLLLSRYHICLLGTILLFFLYFAKRKSIGFLPGYLSNVKFKVNAF